MAEFPDRPTLEEDLRAVLNRHSVENASSTPDFILAAYLDSCLQAWAEATKARDTWWGLGSDTQIVSTRPRTHDHD